MLGRRIMMLSCGALFSAPSTYANILDLHMLVGSGTGGSSDTSTRILAGHLTQNGMNTRVSNRPAGNGVEAAIHVMSQSAGSDVVLSNGIAAIFLAPARERLPYDNTTLVPICMFSKASFVFAVKASSRFLTIDDLIASGKTNTISIANGGAESQYTVSKFSDVVDLNIINAVYRSGGAAAQDLMAGIVDAAYVSVASVAGLVLSGDIRLLAHTNEDESEVPGFSNVPHIFSIGSRDPGLLSYGYHGLYASRQMSKDSIKYIAHKVEQACNDKKFIDEHNNRGMISIFKGPEQLEAHHKIIQNNLITPYIEWIRRINR